MDELKDFTWIDEVTNEESALYTLKYRINGELKEIDELIEKCTKDNKNIKTTALNFFMVKEIDYFKKNY